MVKKGKFDAGELLEASSKKVIGLLTFLKSSVVDMPKPLITQIIESYGKDPFLILISCLLSLRARDTNTIKICKELFSVAKTPQEILNLDTTKLEKILYSGAFYKKNTKLLKEVSFSFLTKFDGKVPNNEGDLLSINGIGRKTANLVLAKAFDIPAICVDVHVHRISNRLGLVDTSTVEETEQALKLITPKEYWADINELFVTWGQNICVPVSPFCSKCILSPLCPKLRVKRSR